eukprot:COSAG02_NODE_16532_length_1075_cov_1.387922_1_plen_131_part_10
MRSVILTTLIAWAGGSLLTVVAMLLRSPGFMAQFGLSGDPATSAEWRAKPIKDEKVIESNQKGYITFAKTGAPNSRTTQLFINYGDNARLDGMGFAPFGKVLGDGMKVVEDIYNIGEKPNQGQIQSEGNAY